MVKLVCYGGAGAVTGANFLLEISGRKVLIDCGYLQGVSGAEEVNESKFEYEPASIDVLFITHAHIDHIGKIPKLVKDGFEGEIYSTRETKEISELMLIDAARIAERNAREEGGTPIYTTHDVEQALKLWKVFNYHEVKEFGGFKVEPYDAGHILGSAMLKFTFPSGKSILFTGDIGNSPSPLLKNTEVVTGAEYILMESVYGDRNHVDKGTKTEKLKKVLLDTIASKGTLLIPVFSLERTQVILHELDNLFESKEVPQVPVFLDSPLAIRVTDIYERVVKHYNSQVQAELRSGDEIFKFPRLKETAQARDSREIMKTHGPKVILAGSGMSTAGRIVNHEEMFLPDPNTTILFLGYQAPGTLGRQISEGVKKVKINDHEIKVRAKVEKIDGYSAHADSNTLVGFVEKCASEKLKQVFVAMGEPRSSIFLAQRLRDELGVNAVVPERTKVYELDL
ncbi:MAG: MBL fold metallo-hydrolase [bacterium]|nr:MBL fold metallo-hydrolase [bacterium]